jgi:2,5-furandicarboxylate decarboxylase 1
VSQVAESLPAEVGPTGFPRADLRAALATLADNGLLETVEKEVVPSWEVTAVLDRLESAGRLPAVLFTSIEGHPGWAIAANLFAARASVAAVLGCSPADLTQTLAARLSAPIAPLVRETGAAQDVVLTGSAATLDAVPLVTHHEGDAAPYISMGVTVCRDPDTGLRNVGIYRYMRQSATTLVPSLTSNANIADIFRRCEERGEPLEIAILPGVHPLIALAAAYNAPIGADEYGVAGALLGEPLPLVRATQVDLEVPADAEVVIEARIQPGARHPEAPFADMSRSYSRIKQGPLTQVVAITHRRRAIHEIAFSGHPDATNMAAICHEVAILEAARRAAPGLTSVAVPASGYGFHCYLAIRKRPTVEGRERGEHINAMLAALGAVPMIKLIIAFDDDVDVHDDTAVLGALARRFQAVDAQTREPRIQVIPAAKGATYDPSSFHREFPNAKLLIDATLRSDLTDEQRASFTEARTLGAAEIDLAAYLGGNSTTTAELLRLLGTEPT